jgi:small conductance mechanosensitive channel
MTSASPLSAAEAGSATGSASPEEIAALIEDLKDPAQREQLIRELEMLREARSQPDAGPSLADVDVGQLLERFAARADQFWQNLLAVDAVWVVEHLLWSVLVVALFGGLYLLIRRGLRRLEQRVAPEEESAGGRGISVDRGFRTGRRFVAFAMLLLTVAVLLQIWGVSLIAWVTALSSFGWMRTALSVFVVGAAALLLLSLSDTLISRTLHAQSNRLQSQRQRARLLTISPLIQGTLRITIGVLALLIILAQLGLNIGPLLAGAGIIGLAVGFGAQSLIKDLLIGVTLLMEDAASVGDIVNVAGVFGEVEHMGIRMMRLRDLDGTVHMIPYSEIAQVSNLTKDYAFAMLDVRVAYRENVDEVIQTLVRTADELRDDPDLGPLILEELEVMGVNGLGESGVEIRIRLKTLPLERFRVARELRRRIKASFDAAGIEIPYPHRVLQFGVDRQGAAEPLRLAQAEARGAGGS